MTTALTLRTERCRKPADLDRLDENDDEGGNNIVNRYEVKHFGFVGKTKGLDYLEYYSEPCPAHKRSSRVAHDHAAFDPPRPIRTGYGRRVWCGNRFIQYWGWHVGDVRTVQVYRKKAEGLAPVPAAGAAGLSHGTIKLLIQEGFVHGKQGWGLAGGKARSDRWLYKPESLKAFVDGDVRGSRVEWIEGRDFYPAHEALRVVAFGHPSDKDEPEAGWPVTLLDFFKWTPKGYKGVGRDCPHLDPPRPLECELHRHQKANRRTREASDGVVISGDDLRTIEAKVKRLPKARAAPRLPDESMKHYLRRIAQSVKKLRGDVARNPGRTAEVLKKQHLLASPQSEAAEVPTFSFGSDDKPILALLAREGGTMKQEQIGKALDSIKIYLSAKTIGGRLKVFREHGVTHRPYGERGGDALTEGGLALCRKFRLFTD